MMGTSLPSAVSTFAPLEAEWLKGRRESTTVGRVKKLRSAILPDMVAGTITDAERERRWRQLADLYLAQQISCYPPDYLRSNPTPERLLETVERFEEDLTDTTRIHSPMTATVQVGAAISVSPTRDRGSAEGGSHKWETLPPARTRLCGRRLRDRH